jgi:aryl-alcohol dehydrogenase-like predicted oxidoreductase
MVLPEAFRRSMGMISMKSPAQGKLVKNSTLAMAEAMGYVLSLPCMSILIIGCTSPAEVDENARLARQFADFTEGKMQELESRTLLDGESFTYYKRPASIGFRRA